MKQGSQKNNQMNILQKLPVDEFEEKYNAW